MITGKQAVDLLPIAGQISAAAYLRAADKQDAVGVRKMIERAEKPNGAHGAFSDRVAGIQAVRDPVDCADYDQRNLIWQQAKTEPGQQLILCRFTFRPHGSVLRFHLSMRHHTRISSIWLYCRCLLFPLLTLLFFKESVS